MTNFDSTEDKICQSQIFPKWTNGLVPWVIAGLMTTFVGATAISYYGYRSDWWQHQNIAPDQPVLFSHHHHVTELKIDCRFCHGSVEDSSFAGMPATETCMTCHSGVFTDSPMLAPVIESYRTKKPLAWQRVYDLPDYVYFDHSVHVANGIGCTSCHGEIGEQRLTRKAQPLYMSWCLDCHRDPGQFVRKQDDIFSPSHPARSTLPEGEKIDILHRMGIVGPHMTDCTTCHR